jgi:hypothetical protein
MPSIVGTSSELISQLAFTPNCKDHYPNESKIEENEEKIHTTLDV